MIKLVVLVLRGESKQNIKKLKYDLMLNTNCLVL